MISGWDWCLGAVVPGTKRRTHSGSRLRGLLVRVGWVERVLTVEFGPSRSKRFRKAVEEARSGAGECSELAPGNYRVRFVLGSDGRVYTSLARLLQRVRTWRATEVYEGDQLVSSYHARDIKIVDCPFHGDRLSCGWATGRSAAAEKEGSRSNTTSARSRTPAAARRERDP